MAVDFIKVNHSLKIPKYKQIINSISKAIDNGLLKRGDKIASINDICKNNSLSRDTVLVAFNELRARGIISSIPGKGYYVETTEVDFQHKIFLLFDELNYFKETLYNSFLENLNGKATVDIYFHHFNRNVFESVILNSINKYNIYVIMPAIFENILPVIQQLPGNEVYILDQLKQELEGKFSAVYQNFEKDIFGALSSGLDMLQKYNKLILVFPGGKEPIGQLKGFEKFANQYGFDHEVISDLSYQQIEKGEVYIMPNDLDLVTLVKQAQKRKIKLGKEVGVISYNDTALKEVVAGGITTISTDFRKMGATLADLVLNRKHEQIENYSSLIRRKSL